MGASAGTSVSTVGGTSRSCDVPPTSTRAPRATAVSTSAVSRAACRSLTITPRFPSAGGGLKGRLSFSPQWAALLGSTGGEAGGGEDLAPVRRLPPAVLFPPPSPVG